MHPAHPGLPTAGNSCVAPAHGDLQSVSRDQDHLFKHRGATSPSGFQCEKLS